MKVGDLVRVKENWQFYKKRTGAVAIIVSLDEYNNAKIRFAVDGHEAEYDKEYLVVISESR